MSLVGRRARRLSGRVVARCRWEWARSTRAHDASWYRKSRSNLPEAFVAIVNGLARFDREAGCSLRSPPQHRSDLRALAQPPLIVMELGPATRLPTHPPSRPKDRSAFKSEALKIASSIGARGRPRTRHRPPRSQAGEQDHARRRRRCSIRAGSGQGRRHPDLSHHHDDVRSARDMISGPLHMSPGAGARQGVDKRTDIWAFGCALRC
jgi:hypothetical protein